MSGTFQGRVAYASFAVAGGAITTTSQSGDFDAPSYSGVGEFRLNLLSQIDPSECVVQITPRNTAANPGYGIVLTSSTDTFINVELYNDTGTLTDPPGFDVLVLVKPAN